ncbi:MAG: ribD [Bacteroidota bacterium]|nr:ribD [Bacteroidota bacterium]
MRRCFELAKLGGSFVAPNPMVGAVLVYGERIIGEGYHQKFGEAHAEVNCLRSVKNEDRHLISNSTLYVSLEPCTHYGKTPPCTDLIIQNKIPKVVISVKDNFHLVKGKGIEKLIKNNVDVIQGILESEGKELIKHFLFFHQYNKPYITLKFARSKDGFIGIKGERVLISNDLSQRHTHRLRAEHQSILVGKNTVLTDNPSLTVRYWNGKNPIRIILSDEAAIPENYHVKNSEAKTIFINDDIQTAIKKIGEKNIISVLVEGGANTLQQFIDAGLWNETHVITSNTELKTGIKAPLIHDELLTNIQLEDNTVQVFKNTQA